MNKSEIIALIATEMEAILDTAKQMDDHTFFLGIAGKWSIAENIEHLHLSVKPLNQALILPFFAFRWLFGRPNRTSRTFEGLSEKYTQKLSAGGRATKAFIPRATGTKAEILMRFEKTHRMFLSKIQHIAESDLEGHILPHPLLGKLTLLEMLFFTAFHIRHHHNIVLKAL